MRRYAKTIVAAAGALVAWGVVASADGAYTQTELWGLALEVGTVIGVFAVPNRPPVGQTSDPQVSELG